MRLHRRLAVLAMGVLALPLTGCGGEAQPPPGTTPTGQDTSQASPSEGADLTWYDEEERAAAAAGPETVWLAGWFVPEALEGVTIADLEVRYRQAATLDADAAAMAQAAFAALADPGPVELINPLEGVTLALLSGRVEDRDGAPTAVLDFGPGIAATNDLGHLAADAETQFHAMVREYFPDASHVVVTVEGAGAELFAGKPYGSPIPLAS